MSRVRIALAGVLVAVAVLSLNGKAGCSVVVWPAKALSAVVIEESKDRTPPQAMVLLSTKFRALFTSFRLIDKDNAYVNDDEKPLIQEAVEKKQLPMLFLLDENGKRRYAGPLPQTVDDAEKLANGLKGVK